MNNPDGITQLAKLVGERSSAIDRALAPTHAIADLVRGIQSPPYLLAVEGLVKAMNQPAHVTALSQMVEAMQREHQLVAEFRNPPRIFSELTNQMAQMRSLSESITSPYLRLQEMMRSQASVFEKISASVTRFEALNLSLSKFSESMLVWNTVTIGLANRMNDLGLLAQRELLSARLFEVPSAYVAFVKHTTDLLTNDPAPKIAARLRGSLNLAEQQLLDIADTANGFIVLPDDDDEPDEVRALNAPFVQQDELLTNDAIDDEANLGAMLASSPTAQTVEHARRVLNLVTKCNEAAKTSSSTRVEIFKPTTRLMTVFLDLPWLSPTDLSSFGIVVDCLYFIFYEGAGKDSLRFLDKHGGPLTAAECELIWCIKHLRNKWSRHDADHGHERDIKKSWADLATHFRWLGLTEHPTDAPHFQQLYVQLLVRAERFLTLILSKLKL